MYVAFATLCVLNIVTAVLVENAHQYATKDDDLTLIQNAENKRHWNGTLRRNFSEHDTDYGNSTPTTTTSTTHHNDHRNHDHVHLFFYSCDDHHYTQLNDQRSRRPPPHPQPRLSSTPPPSLTTTSCLTLSIAHHRSPRFLQSYRFVHCNHDNVHHYIFPCKDHYYTQQPSLTPTPCLTSTIARTLLLSGSPPLTAGIRVSLDAPWPAISAAFSCGSRARSAPRPCHRFLGATRIYEPWALNNHILLTCSYTHCPPPLHWGFTLHGQCQGKHSLRALAPANTQHHASSAVPGQHSHSPSCTLLKHSEGNQSNLTSTV